MINMENLKKQAKELVRLHRAGSFHLACVAREHLPRFTRWSDAEILAADFKLSDAQALIAGQHGRPTWAVADVARAVRYYADILGFEVLRVGDAKALYIEFLAAGATFDTPLHRDPFGPLGFVVTDPDGNLLGFGEPGPGANPDG